MAALGEVAVEHAGDVPTHGLTFWMRMLMQSALLL